MDITSVEFWKAAFWRALRTFIQVILAVWTAGQVVTDVNWKFVFISAGSAAIYSLLTSILAGIPEVKLEKTLYEREIFPEPDEEEETEEVETEEEA